MVKFYHYTSHSNADKIKSSGKIVQSKTHNGDSRAGSGVYLTKLPPGTSDETLTQNNWTTTAVGHKVDVCIEVDLPYHLVKDCSSICSGRDVWKYSKDIILSCCSAVFTNRKSDGRWGDVGIIGTLAVGAVAVLGAMMFARAR